MPVLKWKATKEESLLVGEIAARAWPVVKNGYKDRISLCMDIEATHSNGCPLDFKKLFEFGDFDFYHDIWGIHDNIDRATGKLTNCFLPRCAR